MFKKRLKYRVYYILELNRNCSSILYITVRNNNFSEIPCFLQNNILSALLRWRTRWNVSRNIQQENSLRNIPTQ